MKTTVGLQLSSARAEPIYANAALDLKLLFLNDFRSLPWNYASRAIQRIEQPRRFAASGRLLARDASAGKRPAFGNETWNLARRRLDSR
jgi:hypothetical protein